MASEQQSDASSPQESESPAEEDLATLVPEMDAGQQTLTEDNPDPTRPVVVEHIEGDPASRQHSMSVLCPGCGDVLTRYPTGMPRHLGRVEVHCESCDTTLNRWALLAIDTAHEQTPSPADRRRVTTEYWTRRLWDGILTGETSPRTREYSKLYDTQATAFGWEWQPSCPLCRRERSEFRGELDYHHWQRDPDQGICLCRPCHDALSGQQRDSEIDWQAQEGGLRNKHDLQITRLALRAQAVEPAESLQALVKRLCGRYNLVQSPAEVYALLSQVLTDEIVLDRVDDDHLLAGLNAETATPSLLL